MSSRRDETGMTQRAGCRPEGPGAAVDEVRMLNFQLGKFDHRTKVEFCSLLLSFDISSLSGDSLRSEVWMTVTS